MRLRFQEWVAVGALAVSAALPWSYPIVAAHFPSTRGLLVPGCWLAGLGLAILLGGRPSRLPALGLGLALVGLLSWPAGIQAQLSRPGFTDPAFPFQLVDVLDTGWYLALVALALAAESRARLASGSDAPAGRAELAAWSLVPGLGLVRYQLVARGRLWLLAAGVAILWVHTSGVPTPEMDYANYNHYIPIPFLRNGYFVDAGLVLLVWLLSLLDTWRQVRLWGRAHEAADWRQGWAGRQS